MKVSEFLKLPETPFLLGAFMGRCEITDDKKYIYSLSTYKSSKFVEDNAFYNESKTCYLIKLNLFSCGEVWTREKIAGIKRSEFTCALENDLHLSKEQFFNKLYIKTVGSEFVAEKGLTESKKEFIRGFIELRGSIDGTADYIALDYYYNNQFELNRARLLVDLFNVPVECMNLNFRELQNQFVTGANKRNTQLRVTLSWYSENIGIFNDYKAKIIENAYTGFMPISGSGQIKYFNAPEISKKTKHSFEWRITEYSRKLYGKMLSASQIGSLRNEFGFSDGDNQFKRNIGIVDYIRMFTDDECACCKNEYDISDRSFIHRKTMRPYFEIHHFISVGKNSELDIEENLVKLCPVCHRQLKAGAGLETEQKKCIEKILDNESKCLEFATHIFETDDKVDIVEKVYRSLK